MGYDFEQFYSTPRYLAHRMAMLIPVTAKSVLEPSAGKGSLIKAVKDRISGSVHYCEIDEERNKMIKTTLHAHKVGGDFLKMESDRAFDGVIMNPPFNRAEDHFLKAYDHLQEGGKMVCLVSKETLEGKSKKEVLMMDIINKHHGEVDLIQGAFAQKRPECSKKSQVSCYLIHFTKGVKTQNNQGLHEGLTDVKNEVALLDQSTEEKRLKAYNFIETLVENFERSKQQYETCVEAFHNLEKCAPVKYDSNFYPTLGKGEFINELRSQCWTEIFKSTKIANYMTTAMRKSFDEMQNGTSVKEFTVENIQALLRNLMLSMEGITKEAVKTVFDLFTQYHKENRAHIEGWKTNSAWKVNRKIILPGMLDAPFMKSYPNHVSSRGENKLQDIEKALCLMTGTTFDKITNSHNSSVKTALGYLAEDDFGVWHDTYFFKVKVFKKQTMHLHFKSNEVWEQFNKMAVEGKMWLGVD